MVMALQGCVFATIVWLCFAVWLLFDAKNREIAGLINIVVAFYGTGLMLMGIWLIYPLGIYNDSRVYPASMNFASTGDSVLYSVKYESQTYTKVLSANDVRNPE